MAKKTNGKKFDDMKKNHIKLGQTFDGPSCPNCEGETEGKYNSRGEVVYRCLDCGYES